MRGSAAVLLALLVTASACGSRTIGARDHIAPPVPPSCVHADVAERTPGLAHVAVIPSTREVERIAFHGDTLVATALDVCRDARELVLWRFDTASQRLTSVPLGVAPGGLWHGLDVADDGTAWVAARDALVGVSASGAVTRVALPVAQHALPFAFGGHARAPHVAGLATALAVAGDVVAIGRAGHRELTLYDSARQTSSAIRLDGFGEVRALASYSADEIAFVTTRADDDPLAGHGAAGVLHLGTRQVSELAHPVSWAAAAPSVLAYRGPATPAAHGGAQALGVSAAGRTLWERDASDYDTSQFAVRGDGVLAVRAAGALPELVLIRRDGAEARRVSYSVPTFGGRIGGVELSAIAFAPRGAAWFAIRGRPELYRAN